MATLFTILAVLTVINVLLLVFSSNAVDKKPSKEVKVYKTSTTQSVPELTLSKAS
jgi:competence protein ComGC